MYSGKLVFAQVMEFAPWHVFRRLVTKYRGDFNARSFSRMDQRHTQSQPAGSLLKPVGQ